MNENENNMATVAPNDAPEEIPVVYGSASGFFIMLCMTAPHAARPIPTMAPVITRGSLVSHTIKSLVGSMGFPMIWSQIN